MPATQQKPKRKPKSGPCTCANLIDNKLRDYNTRLARQFTLDFEAGTAGASIVIQTEKIDSKKREKAKTVLPTYCPFCGKKYC